MSSRPESYPWDEVFDGDKAAQEKVYRGGSWYVFAKLHESAVRMASPDNHWSYDVKHKGGEND